MSAMDRNNTSASSLDDRNPRRRQNTAASSSTELTTKARPPISAAPLTLRASAWLNSPVPIPRPIQA